MHSITTPIGTLFTIPTTFPVIPTYNNWFYPHNLLFVDYPEDGGSMHLQNYGTH